MHKYTLFVCKGKTNEEKRGNFVCEKSFMIFEICD